MHETENLNIFILLAMKRSGPLLHIKKSVFLLRLFHSVNDSANKNRPKSHTRVGEPVMALSFKCVVSEH